MVSLYFETTSPFLQSRAAVADALRRAVAFTSHPNWLRKDGKPVIFFWRPSAVARNAGESAIDAWRSLRQEVDPNHNTIWIGEGDDFSYLSAFDGIHPFSIAWSGDPAGTLSTLRPAHAGQGGPAGPAQDLGAGDYARLRRPPAAARGRLRPPARGRRLLRPHLRGGAGLAAGLGDHHQLVQRVVRGLDDRAQRLLRQQVPRPGARFLGALQVRALASAARAGSAPGNEVEFAIPGGRFFRQTGPGDGRGYAVTNAEGVPFWDEFQRLGGPQVVGYPLSRRFAWDGLVTQVFQKAVFQWKPAEGRVDYINVFDQLSVLGKDEWLAKSEVHAPAAGRGRL